MQTQIKKWGNSLALRIPKAFAEEMAITDDSSVEIAIIDGKLVIVPTAEPEYLLEEMLEQISSNNLHEEIDSGDAIGGEVW